MAWQAAQTLPGQLSNQPPQTEHWPELERRWWSKRASRVFIERGLSAVGGPAVCRLGGRAPGVGGQSWLGVREKNTTVKLSVRTKSFIDLRTAW